MLNNFIVKFIRYCSFGTRWIFSCTGRGAFPPPPLTWYLLEIKWKMRNFQWAPPFWRIFPYVYGGTVTQFRPGPKRISKKSWLYPLVIKAAPKAKTTTTIWFNGGQNFISWNYSNVKMQNFQRKIRRARRKLWAQTKITCSARIRIRTL